MIISNQKSVIEIRIRDSILTKVSTVKFLGVTLDENLTFNDHVKNFTTKISKSVGVMRRLHCQLPADVKVKLYYSLVYSHLTHGLLSTSSRRLIFGGAVIALWLIGKSLSAVKSELMKHTRRPESSMFS